MIPRVGCLLVAVVAACSDGVEPTQLVLNVAVERERVAVYAREVARPCECSIGEWVDPGTCGGSSDAITCTCDPPPASCLDTLHLERAGAVVAEAPFGSPGGTGYLLLDETLSGTDLALVLDGCGGRARIPIDVAGAPVPTIDEVVDGGDTVTVRWSAEPAAASSQVLVGDGFVSTECHVTGTEHTFDFSELSPQLFVGVFASAPPVVVATELGTATVWIGDRTGQSIAR